jgi:hypothetical protein
MNPVVCLLLAIVTGMSDTVDTSETQTFSHPKVEIRLLRAGEALPFEIDVITPIIEVDELGGLRSGSWNIELVPLLRGSVVGPCYLQLHRSGASLAVFLRTLNQIRTMAERLGVELVIYVWKGEFWGQ